MFRWSDTAFSEPHPMSLLYFIKCTEVPRITASHKNKQKISPISPSAKTSLLPLKHVSQAIVPEGDEIYVEGDKFDQWCISTGCQQRRARLLSQTHKSVQTWKNIIMFTRLIPPKKKKRLAFLSGGEKKWQKCQQSSSIYQIMRNLNCTDISSAAFKIHRGTSHLIQPVCSTHFEAGSEMSGNIKEVFGLKSGDHDYQWLHTNHSRQWWNYTELSLKRGELWKNTQAEWAEGRGCVWRCC